MIPLKRTKSGTAIHRNSLLLSVCVLCLVPAALAAGNPPDVVSSFLTTHCVDCHSGDSAEGGLDLQTIEFDLNDSELTSHWVRIHDRVRAGEMPPQDATFATPSETATFIKQMGSWIRSEQSTRQQQQGRVPARRLTGLQLARTLQDLLGIDIPLTDLLPEDPRTGGFTTVAEGQPLSHFQLERHLSVVDAALDEAWRRAIEGDDVWTKELSAKQLSRTRPRTREPEYIDNCAVVWSSRLAFYGRIPATTAREDGWYRFTIRAHSLKDRGEDIWTTVRSGRCVSSAPLMDWVGAFETPQEGKEVTFQAWLPKGDMLEIRPGDATLKMASFQGGQSGNGEGGAQNVPGIAIESITMEKLHRGPDAVALRRMLFDDLDLKTKNGNARLVSERPKQDAERLLKRFADRAFRRPVADDELAPYIAAVRDAIAEEGDLLAALRLGYRALLCSPRFLFFSEEPGPLDDYAIASRLSYFLWNRMPDDELMQLAEAGTLHKPAVLHRQVERMLADARGADFVRDFASEWLDLSEIEATEPERRVAPDFDQIVLNSMLGETQTFLQTMLAADLSVAHLVDSDFTFLNSRLARFYDIDHVDGDQLQRVSLLPEHRRSGGVLTHGAILKVTANGTTTSPVLRGVWVNERLLGEHIPPPPKNVPAIEPDVRGATTIREMLEKHRSDAACASCHSKIDPPGFALENFNPAGQWRNTYTDARSSKRRLPIDASATLPDGRKFKNADEFQQLIAENTDQLARNVAEKMTTYGTGASPSFADREAIDAIVASAAEANYGFRSLLHAVVTSPLFLSK